MNKNKDKNQFATENLRGDLEMDINREMMDIQIKGSNKNSKIYNLKEHMSGNQGLSENNYIAIKKAIADKVMTYDHVSFVEVQKIFDSHNFDYNGNSAICHPRYANLIFWDGWNVTAIKILTETLKEYSIMMHTSFVLNYIIDGVVLDLPIAKKMRSYKRDRWYPVVLRPAQK